MGQPFPNITENLALNFINSRLIRKGKMIELIKSSNDLVKWTEQPLDDNKLYNTQLSTFNFCLDDEIDIEELLIIRLEIYNCLLDLIDGKLTLADFKQYIEINILTNPFSIIFIEDIPVFVPVKSGVEGIKSLLFLGLSQLVESGDINKLSKCTNPLCPLIFINKTGRKKWCSMKICGNRNKVERYENKNRGK